MRCQQRARRRCPRGSSDVLEADPAPPTDALRTPRESRKAVATPIGPWRKGVAGPLLLGTARERLPPHTSSGAPAPRTRWEPDRERRSEEPYPFADSHRGGSAPVKLSQREGHCTASRPDLGSQVVN